MTTNINNNNNRNNAILNLTQHPATAEQIEAGVVEPEDKGRVRALLTFDAPPSTTEIYRRASQLAEIARHNINNNPSPADADHVLIGGAPYLMSALEFELECLSLIPVYSFSQRVSEENAETGEKVSVFKHIAFIES